VSLPIEVWAWLTDPASWTGPSAIPLRLGEHVAISLAAVGIAMAIAFPAGLFIGHTRRGERLAVNLATLGRAIPSLAAIGILVPLTVLIDPDAGFRLYPTLFAMIILAIPPILVNTYTGIAGVDPDVVEAARAMGLTERQVLGRIELPLALPAILAGVRSANVQVIATATLGAYYSLGALGSYLVEGIAQNDDGKLFGGVVLVALLALGSEAILALAQRRLSRSHAPRGSMRAATAS
jgi:osmoprotectant transport system permease protein